MQDRDLRFIDEYMIDFDAKNAAIRAGFSASTARNACDWIRAENPTKPRVRAEVDRRMAAMSRRCGISAERVLRELAGIAFSNIADAGDPETGMVRRDADRDDLAAIASIHIRSGEAMEYDVRMCDKLRALEMLGKRLGLFTDSIEISGSVPVIIDDA